MAGESQKPQYILRPRFNVGHPVYDGDSLHAHIAPRKQKSNRHQVIGARVSIHNDVHRRIRPNNQRLPAQIRRKRPSSASRRKAETPAVAITAASLLFTRQMVYECATPKEGNDEENENGSQALIASANRADRAF